MTNPIGPDVRSWRDQLFAAQQRGLTIRDLERLSGLSYGAAYGAYTGQTRNPQPETVRAIRYALEQLPTFVTERPRTIAEDRVRWTADDVANLVPPRGSRFFQLIWHDADTETGYGSSGWQPLGQVAPFDVMRGIGAHPDAIARVVWEKPGGRGG